MLKIYTLFHCIFAFLHQLTDFTWKFGEILCRLFSVYVMICFLFRVLLLVKSIPSSFEHYQRLFLVAKEESSEYKKAYGQMFR